MRSILFAVLCVVSGMAAAAPYPCPPPLSASAVGCTLTSPGGTTTFQILAAAQIFGSAQNGAAVMLNMTNDNLPCNANYGQAVFAQPVMVGGVAHPEVEVSTSVNGSCTFDVTSRHPVQFLAVAPNFAATPVNITLNATAIAFLPDTFLSVAVSGNGSVYSNDSGISCGTDCTESYAPASVVTLTAVAGVGATFTGWSGDCAGAAATCAIAMSQTRNVTAHFASDAARVVEFYNATLDHYFITADANEATLVDNGGAGPGWVRTGLSFKPGGFAPVCRFYGSVSPGPNSHFYTSTAEECNALKALQAVIPASSPRWNYEGTAFATHLPANGTCPLFSIPVYRAYNNGFALGKESNHRFSTDPQAIQEVVARGWKFEGTVMCVLE